MFSLSAGNPWILMLSPGVCRAPFQAVGDVPSVFHLTPPVCCSAMSLPTWDNPCTVPWSSIGVTSLAEH